MLGLLYNLGVSFLVLGVVEAVIKPVAKRFVQRKIIKYAPMVYRVIDPMMPYLLVRYSGAELEQIVRQKFTELTGEDWSQTNLEPFWQWYDPRKNADHA